MAGIALVNAIAFAMPSAAYVNPRAFGGDTMADIVAWALVFLIVEDKFRALFAMLFGAGVAILLGRPGSGGLSGHYRRMAVLLVIGLLHATLLASNDILRVYAVAGLVLPLCVGLKPRTLYWLAGAIMLAQLVISLVWFREYLLAWWQGNRPDLLVQIEALFGSEPRSIAAALDQGRETFAERLARRWAHEPGYSLRVMAGLPSSLAAMLVGIGLWHDGLLKGTWSRMRAVRLFLWVGIPSWAALAAMALFEALRGFEPVLVSTVALVWSAPFDLLLAVGWSALITAAFARKGALTRVLAAAGRLALTNYLITSAILAGMFARWGLGMFGQVGRLDAYLLAMIPIALIMALSPLWLARFRQGPAEWAWRSLAQGRLLPFRRSAGI